MEGTSLPMLLFENNSTDGAYKKRKNNLPVENLGQQRHVDNLQSSDAFVWPCDDAQDENQKAGITTSKDDALLLTDHQRTSTTEDDEKYDNGQASDRLITTEASGYQNFAEVLSDIGQKVQMSVLQFSQTLSQSEQFEQQGLQIISDLQGSTQVLQQRIVLQKETLCKRLRVISDNLNCEQ